MRTWQKINLYILSLAILFAFWAVLYFPNLESVLSQGILHFLYKNIVFCISICSLVYCITAYKILEHSLGGSGEIACSCHDVKQVNYEHLTFLTTYVVPIVGVNLDKPTGQIGVLLLLVLTGTIFIKTDIFYQNPSLALLGFHIYTANIHVKSGEVRRDVILITRTDINEDQYIDYIKLDKRIYYARSCNSGTNNLKI